MNVMKFYNINHLLYLWRILIIENSLLRNIFNDHMLATVTHRLLCKENEAEFSFPWFIREKI